MRGPIALPAEVAERINQGAAEVVLPDAVHDHAGRERRAVGNNSLGEFEPAASLGEGLRPLSREDSEELPGHDRPGLVRVAARVHGDVVADPVLVLEARRVRATRHHRHVPVHHTTDGDFFVPRRRLQARDAGRQFLQFGLGIGGRRFLRLQSLHLLVQRLDFHLGLSHGLGFRIGEERKIDQLHSRDHARQCVVILGADGVEFVVMTAGTRDRKAQERAAHRVDLLFPLVRDDGLDHVHVELQFLPVIRAAAQEPQSRRVPSDRHPA